VLWELWTELYLAGLKGVVGTADKIIPCKLNGVVGTADRILPCRSKGCFGNCGQNYTVQS
jgi:hypothetical protein